LALGSLSRIEVSLIDFIKKMLNKSERKPSFGSSFVELPGYGKPSVEDLKLEVVLFEKRVKDYASHQGISLKKSNSENKNVYGLLNELNDLNPYADIDTENQKWHNHIEELHELRKFRSKIIHIDHTDLPSVEDLYSRYKSANQLLIPLRFNGGCTVSNFKPIKWIGATLINGSIYHFYYADIDNLSIQLHPASRGAVYYKSGKQVVVKITDYDYANLTVFIEGCPSFQITEDEAAILDDLLLSVKGERVYGA